MRAAIAVLDWPLGTGLIHGDAWAGNLLSCPGRPPAGAVLGDWDCDSAACDLATPRPPEPRYEPAHQVPAHQQRRTVYAAVHDERGHRAYAITWTLTIICPDQKR